MSKKQSHPIKGRKTLRHSFISENIPISIFFVFVILFTTFKMSGDDDVFWHLETGKYIIENKIIPSSDVFGFATSGERWIPFEWGWDVISDFIYSVSGFSGLSILRTLIFLAVFYFFIRLIRKLKLNIPVTLLIFVGLMFAMIDRLNPKPQIISYLLFSILLYLLISFQTFNRDNLKVLYPIPLIFLIWCNMHMGVIAGAVILVIFLLSESLNYFKPGSYGQLLSRLEKKQFMKLILICSISLLVLLANPFGYNTYSYVYSHLRMKMLEEVFEWYSPFNQVFSGTLFQYIYYIFLLFAVFTIYYAYRGRSYFVMACSIIFVLLSFRASRYAIDFMVVQSLFSAVIFGSLINSSANKKTASGTGTQTLIITVSAIIVIITILLPGNQLYDVLKYTRSSGFGVDSRDYPVKMLEFIKANNIQNIGSKPFNSYFIGGYFIHELEGKRNFIDSRNLSDDIYYKYKAINNKSQGFERLLQEFDFDYVVWFFPGLVNNSKEIETSIVSFLINKKDLWKLVYWDDNSFLFVKNDERFSDVINKYEYKFVNPLYYIYEREPLKKAISEHMQEVVNEIRRKYKDEPNGNFINSIAKTFKVPLSR